MKRTLGAAVVSAVALLVAAPAQADLASCRPADLAQAVAVPPQYMHPKLMAIGDSLYNGTESLSLSRQKAINSVPYYVARALGDSGFRTPQYDEEHPILVDFDRELTTSIEAIVSFLLNNLGHDVRKNIWWYADPARVPYFQSHMPLFFDDVAVAQADSAKMMCDSAVSASDFIVTALRNAKDPTGIPPRDPGGAAIPAQTEHWFYDLNARFVLNPSFNSSISFMRASQLAQAIARQPGTLLIDAGANDGVWLMAFDAYGPDTCYGRDDPNNPAYVSPGTPGSACRPLRGTPRTSVRGELGDWVANMTEVARELVPLQNTTTIVNLLGPPSAVANLAPLGDRRATGNASFYFAFYQNYLSLGTIRTVDAATVRAMDLLVAQKNQETEAAMCKILGPDHVAFVDLYALLKKFDRKNSPYAQAVQVTADLSDKLGPRVLTLDNRVVQADPPRGLFAGGLFSYDNMHPTAMGYALIANAVLNTLDQQSRRPKGGAGKCLVVSDTGAERVRYQDIANQISATGGNHLDSAIYSRPGTTTLLKFVHSYLVSNAAKTDNQKAARSFTRMMRTSGPAGGGRP